MALKHPASERISGGNNWKYCFFFGIVMLVVQGTFKYAYLNFQKKEAVSSSKISGEIQHLDKCFITAADGSVSTLLLVAFVLQLQSVSSL